MGGEKDGMLLKVGSMKKEVAPKKGCLAIRVGGEGEEQKRFIVPLVYLNHPLFLKLLKVAEDEYGFHHKGTITIPCHVDEFCYVQGVIDRDHHKFHHPQALHTHHALVGCFRA